MAEEIEAHPAGMIWNDQYVDHLKQKVYIMSTPENRKGVETQNSFLGTEAESLESRFLFGK